MSSTSSRPATRLVVGALTLALLSCEGTLGEVSPSATAPRLEAFTPSQGPEGTEVSLTGSGFSGRVEDDAVSFAGVAAAVTSATTSTLTARVPVGARTGRVAVTVQGVTVTSTLDFTVTERLPDPVDPPEPPGTSGPSLSGFAPSQGPVGTEVVLSGGGFGATSAENAVAFAGVTAAVKAATASRLTVTVPAGATTGRVAVTVRGVTATSTSDFAVTAAPPGPVDPPGPPTSPAPSLRTFTPSQGAVGTEVTLAGGGFGATVAENTVTFAGVAAVVKAASATSLTVTVPRGARTGRVAVTVGDTTATSTTDFTVTAPPSGPRRVLERLDRGLVAVNLPQGKAFVSWRLLGTEPADVAFNLYRATDQGAPVKLNAEGPLATRTSWTDSGLDSSKTQTYTVKAVVGGVEEGTGASFVVPANTPVRQYLPIKLAPLASPSGGTYSVLHAYVGDLDGDGAYELLAKRLDSNRAPIVLDAYELDGTHLWRIDLGPNIETGNSSATSPVLVVDLDGDGKAEVVMKTGEGTVFGDGSRIGDTDGDGKTDYNSHDPNAMYQVLSGPEFISVVEGTTGKELARTDFIARGTSTDWGDDYGNRMNFIFATVAYLDGVHPSFVMSRGDGELDNPKALTATAWSYRNRSLTRQWTWTAKAFEGKLPQGQMLSDFHAIRAMDVDGDGKDELSWGGFTLKPDGTLLFATTLTHGDRFVIADIAPDRPGLEQYAIQQNNPTLLGAALTDARTGQVLQRYSIPALADVGRGDAAALLPGRRGLQTFNSSLAGLFDASGAQVSATSPWPSLSLWWDGDLLRESFDGIGANGYNPAIQKWDPVAGKLARLFTVYNDTGSYAVTCPYAGRPPLYGDLLGDWREEVVLETSDHSELRLYTTTIPTEYRMPTLMHDPAYRNTVNVKGYLQSTQVGYYLGDGMTFPVPPPNIATAPSP